MDSKQAFTDFIQQYPKDIQAKLNQLVDIIEQCVPQAERTMAYGIPTFTYFGNLIHFSAYQSHIGLYPGAKAIEHFKRQIDHLKTSKGTIQFPNEVALPDKLIREICLYCKNQNEEKIRASKQSKYCENGHLLPPRKVCTFCPKCSIGDVDKSKAFDILASPARRALQAHQVYHLADLGKFTETEIASWHGIGPSALDHLRSMMKQEKFTFLRD